MEQLLTALQVITAHEEEVNVTDKAIKEVKTEKKKSCSGWKPLSTEDKPPKPPRHT